MADWQDFLAALGGFGAGASQAIGQIGQTNAARQFQLEQQGRLFGQQTDLERMREQAATGRLQAQLGQQRELNTVPSEMLYPHLSDQEKPYFPPGGRVSNQVYQAVVGRWQPDRFGGLVNTMTGERKPGPFEDLLRGQFGAGAGGGRGGEPQATPENLRSTEPFQPLPPRERISRTRFGVSAFGMPTVTTTESPYTTNPDYLTAFRNLGLDPNYVPTPEQSQALSEEVGKIRGGYQKQKTTAGITAQTENLPGLQDISQAKGAGTAAGGIQGKVENINDFGKILEMTANAMAKARAGALGEIRQVPVIDTQNGNALTFANANDINEANRQTPGRFVPAAPGAQALNKQTLLEDIRGTINTTRDALTRLPTDFTAAQSAQIALILKQRDPRSALSAFMGGAVGRTLTPEQQDYLIALAQLQENAMAMRSVLGAGQGSDELRAAILRTIPSALTPSRDYARKQLDAFEATLNRLGRGLPNVPLRQMPETAPGAANPARPPAPGKPPGRPPAGPAPPGATHWSPTAGYTDAQGNPVGGR